MRTALVFLGALAACGGGGGGGSSSASDRPPARGSDAAVGAPVAAAAAPLASKAYPDLASALAAIVPADARVLGFGELHARTDRPQVASALDRFTREALPGLAPKLSDLVIETWVQDRACGALAADATARVETTMRRPVATKNEIAALASAARAAHIQPHAMTISCADYARIAPPGQEVDAVAMLALTTRELGRLAAEAVAQRDREPGHRPMIAIYGGALHNDRFPETGTEEWSYAAGVDRATGGGLVEIDLIVPEYAVGDAASQRQPWYPLAANADAQVHVWQRGERSFVIVLARSP